MLQGKKSAESAQRNRCAGEEKEYIHVLIWTASALAHRPSFRRLVVYSEYIRSRVSHGDGVAIFHEYDAGLSQSWLI